MTIKTKADCRAEANRVRNVASSMTTPRYRNVISDIAASWDRLGREPDVRIPQYERGD